MSSSAASRKLKAIKKRQSKAKKGDDEESDDAVSTPQWMGNAIKSSKDGLNIYPAFRKGGEVFKRGMLPACVPLAPLPRPMLLPCRSISATELFFCFATQQSVVLSTSQTKHHLCFTTQPGDGVCMKNPDENGKPYLRRLDLLFEDAQGHMCVLINWMYYPEETPLKKADVIYH